MAHQPNSSLSDVRLGSLLSLLILDSQKYESTQPLRDRLCYLIGGKTSEWAQEASIAYMTKFEGIFISQNRWLKAIMEEINCPLLTAVAIVLLVKMKYFLGCLGPVQLSLPPQKGHSFFQGSDLSFC